MGNPLQAQPSLPGGGVIHPAMTPQEKKLAEESLKRALELQARIVAEYQLERTPQVERLEHLQKGGLQRGLEHISESNQAKGFQRGLKRLAELSKTKAEISKRIATFTKPLAELSKGLLNIILKIK